MYLLDAHSLIYQVFHAVPPMTGPQGQPTNAVFGFVGDLLRLRARKPDYLIAVLDPPGKTFRDDIYPDYKAQRAPMPDDLQLQIPLIQKALEALRIPIVMIPGYEADDAIATIARQAAARGVEVFICSSDKDLRQLLSPQIKIYNVRKDLVLDEAALLEDWGVRADQVVDLLTLTGDTVDNVPGVPGVGVKTAAKLLQEHGNVAKLIENLPNLKKSKLKENLIAHAVKLPLGEKLVRLADDVPVSIDWEAWKVQPLNVDAALAFFSECGFHRYKEEVRKQAAAEGQVVSASEEVSSIATEAPIASRTPAKAPRKKSGATGQGSLFAAEDASSSTLDATRVKWEATYTLIDTPAKFLGFHQDFKKQSRFAVDLETTSLNPIDAEIVGIAISWELGRAFYLALRGPHGQPTLDPAETLAKLKPILENEAIAKVNQNIKYDLAVFRQAGVDLKGIAGDSMVASYLLNPGERVHNLDDLSLRFLNHQPISIESLIGKGKQQRRMDEVDTAQIAEYAAEDADVAWRLCAALEPQLEPQGLTTLYRELEVPLIPVLARMERAGVCLDVTLLGKLSSEFAEQLIELKERIYEQAGHPFNIDSPKQLRAVLFDELKLPKQRKTAISGEASTAQEVLEDLAAAGHELPKSITAYRQLAKLKGTYIDALPAQVHSKTGRLHCSFNQTVAATGRLSCSDPNLQNIPTRTEQGQQIRRAFIAPGPDHVLLTADYSQVELRILAHCAGDEVLKKAFAEDQDIHNLVASQIFGVPPEHVDKAQRRAAKTVNFGVIYGLSAFGLARRLGIENAEAEAFIDAYFARYPGVAAFQQMTLDETRTKGYVTTVLGRRRYIQGIRPRSSHRQRNQPEREALNSVIQGSAADLIKRAMLRIDHRLKQEALPATMILQIHDELVFEVQQDSLAALSRLVVQEMTNALALTVPLKVDLAAGPNWLDTEPVELGR